jgi:hypothetical protein
MTRTAAIFTTRAFSSDFTSLYESMHFLREYDRIVFYHAYGTDKVVEAVERLGRVVVSEVVHTKSWFDRCVSGDFPTWRHFYEAFDPHVPERGIDDVYLFGAPLSDGGKLKRKHNGLQKNLDNNKFITFVSVAKHYFTAYAAVKLANVTGAAFHEVCYDPGENSVGQLVDVIRPVSVRVYHGYDIARFGIEKHRFFQDGMAQSRSSPFDDDDEVDHDVVFGYSYMTRDRRASHEYAQDVISVVRSLPGVRSRFLVKNKVEGYDTSVSREEYMRLIRKSRFTFVAPAYEPGVFSPFRYIEAVLSGCLPLVFETCAYREFFDSWGVPVDSVHATIVNRGSVAAALEMDEMDRRALVEYLRAKFLA